MIFLHCDFISSSIFSMMNCERFSRTNYVNYRCFHYHFSHIFNMLYLCNFNSHTKALTSFFTRTFVFFNDWYKLSIIGFDLDSFNTLCCYSFAFFVVKYLFINVLDEFLYCNQQKSLNFLFLKYNTFLARYCCYGVNCCLYFYFIVYNSSNLHISIYKDVIAIDNNTTDIPRWCFINSFYLIKVNIRLILKTCSMSILCI